MINNEPENIKNLEQPYSGHTLPCQCAAKCLQDSLPHLPRELQQNLVHTYSDLTSYNQAVEHTTVLTTYSVLMVFLPLLDSARLRRLVFVLGPGLASLVGHPSLTQLVDHVYYADQEVLCLLH